MNPLVQSYKVNKVSSAEQMCTYICNLLCMARFNSWPQLTAAVILGGHIWNHCCCLPRLPKLESHEPMHI